MKHTGDADETVSSNSGQCVF